MNNINTFVGAMAAIVVLAAIVGFFVWQTRNINTGKTAETVEQDTTELETEAQATPESVIEAGATDEQH
ncbi:MAG: hypothetical protein GY805_36090 [Chloroflexi bacterium]|nr:hypothetical protein [Chloroflexota bacterium]